ncbi:glutathione S-transferase family protein [Thalassobius sp. Cn5-15]|jgi:glutathione S-transferase|uniref:glutathione S-transferase family protein n=1 Tax=Thalassobius sp. Cn5-15 TaxID=2917763 RepID=UPI001EF1CDE7|nr:glutathione S-transferase family protein [Thalassobius sp. Cn5-15]MCG7493138.1 glutathione S-transferase family protein [Thalassobius sp. Cn5-15]
MEPRYTLHYAPDNASAILRLVLEELDIAYTTQLVDRSTNEQNSASYRALNPTGKIPTLITPHGAMSEVAACLLYLSEQHKALAPTAESADRPAFLKWLLFTANTLHPDLAMHFYLHRYGDDAAIASMRKAVIERLKDHLTLIDRHISTDTPAYLGGDRLSVLDFYVGYTLRWCALYPRTHASWFRLSDYPALARLAARLETRPSMAAVQKAEGLGLTPLTAPRQATPPEGVAL